MVFDLHLDSGHPSGTHVQIRWKMPKNCFLNPTQCSQFSSKYPVLHIILKLIYHRFYKKNLFLPVALYKTTTDQNVDTTWLNPIHFILGFAVRAAQSR